MGGAVAVAAHHVAGMVVGQNEQEVGLPRRARGGLRAGERGAGQGSQQRCDGRLGWNSALEYVEESSYSRKAHDARPKKLPAADGGRGRRAARPSGARAEAQFPGDSRRRYGLLGCPLLWRGHRHAESRPPGGGGNPLHPGVLHGALRAVAKLAADRVLRAADGLRRHDAGQYPGLHAVHSGLPEAARLPQLSFRQVAHPVHDRAGAWGSTTPTRCWTRTATSRRAAWNSTESRCPSPSRKSITTPPRRSPIMRSAF